MKIGKLVGQTSLGLVIIVLGLVICSYACIVLGNFLAPNASDADQVSLGFGVIVLQLVLLPGAYQLGKALWLQVRSRGLLCLLAKRHTDPKERYDFNDLGEEMRVGYCTVCNATLYETELPETKLPETERYPVTPSGSNGDTA
jgi:hypothetical protein